MDQSEFREFGKAAIDFVADYLENIRERYIFLEIFVEKTKNHYPDELK
jgi:hypothetical protein